MDSFRFVFFTSFFLSLGMVCFSQSFGEIRSKKIAVSPSVQKLDTLSIIDETFRIWGPDNQLLDSAFYKVNFSEAIIRLKVPEYWSDDSLRVSFRVFPVYFPQPYFHRDTTKIYVPGPGDNFISQPFFNRNLGSGLIPSESISSSGSITRGITLGNNQDVVLNSAMNLQLSGELAQGIEIAGVISDQDIPSQPEGTTRQVQDFDKVFLRVSGKGGNIVAGDFEMQRPESFFMNFSKKVQGGMINYSTTLDSESGIFPGSELHVNAAGAISKGKYTRNNIKAIEGNQGPYPLQGENKEPYIMVLADSEKIFLDGELLVRGMDQDYVIDYNLAEITFTSRRLITRESRIVAEFEYAERNFARSNLFSGIKIMNHKSFLNINFFSSQDHPSQPLFQELSDERIEKMSQAGDSLHQAFDWSFDSIGWHNDRVMYRLTDSLGFDTVFVHSVDSTQAVFRVNFTYLGEGSGNYRQVSSAANGRVFQWIMPVNGIPQGTHEPIIQLVVPRKNQMLTIATGHYFSKTTKAGIEFAYSNNDLNLFSGLHQNDDAGYAVKFDVNKLVMPFRGNPEWSLNLRLDHEFTGNTFSLIERYRPVEFERDWNLLLSGQEVTQHLSGFEALLINPGVGEIRYNFHSLFREDLYQGIMNKLDASYKIKNNNLFYSGSMLNSSGAITTSFYRHKAGFSSQIFFLIAGVDHLYEDNNVRYNNEQIRSISGFFTDELTFYVMNREEENNRYRVFHKIRTDRLPLESSTQEVHARETGLSVDLTGNADHRFHMTAVYRQSDDSRDNSADPESSVAARVNYSSRLANGIITASLFYEAGSGMERKREFTYLEVPAGQGIYTWNDYNQNQVMELDEFEVARFPDQANFIRVFTQTEGFISVFSNTFSNTLNVDPYPVWREQQGIKKVLSRFSNQLNYRIQRKVHDDISFESFNPFSLDSDNEAVVSLGSSFRNTLFFNRANPVFGAEIFFQKNLNKMLLNNGFETRANQNAGIGLRWNISRAFALNFKAVKGVNKNYSEYFSARNFTIKNNELEPSISYQTGGKFRLSLFAGYSEKSNDYPGSHERAVTGKTGTDIRFAVAGKSTLGARYEYSYIDFPFNINSPVAFEMLNGLKPGKNHLWNITWQQNLNAWLQLIVSYQGRKSPAVKTIHSGNAQIRAFF